MRVSEFIKIIVKSVVVPREENLIFHPRCAGKWFSSLAVLQFSIFDKMQFILGARQKWSRKQFAPCYRVICNAVGKLWCNLSWKIAYMPPFKSAMMNQFPELRLRFFCDKNFQTFCKKIESSIELISKLNHLLSLNYSIHSFEFTISILNNAR